ncbi:AEC family transporter [Albirhodobacter sp. R86504]|jgi:predicted permease|uniref:AEC family transporter n=1 Tax=Albirhodobacter sp. R86504 TaxID=3093848 RepID=UPI00366C8D86
MFEFFMKTLPFFAVIGLGYYAGRTRFFPAEATAWLTKFVFYFALSAMLFRFTATLDLDELLDANFIAAYFVGTMALWVIAFGVAKFRGQGALEAAMEAHSCVTGNTGFLGVPLLVALLGERAIGPILVVLAIDLIVFSSLVTLIIAGVRHGKISPSIFKALGMGLAKNPMIVWMVIGLLWAAFKIPMPAPVMDFATLLGAAATPGALFAIGASLADKSAERIGPAVWLSGAKLLLHPTLVLVGLMIFPVDTFAAGVMLSTACLPVAGNVYILAQHYGVAPTRVSAAILISTIAAIVTLPIVISWVTSH